MAFAVVDVLRTTENKEPHWNNASISCWLLFAIDKKTGQWSVISVVRFIRMRNCVNSVFLPLVLSNKSIIETLLNESQQNVFSCAQKIVVQTTWKPPQEYTNNVNISNEIMLVILSWGRFSRSTFRLYPLLLYSFSGSHFIWWCRP